VPEDLKRRWAQKLAHVAPLRVGLAWSGGGLSPKNPARSIRLEQLSRLLAIAGANFVNLQKGGPADQLQGMDSTILDWMSECDDLMDTAALMEQLDLIITVDTAVAHLAGALGKPVWMMNRFESEWRWLLQREDSPWYPTMRIFRQQERGHWDDVVARVAAELQGHVAAGRRLG
jgi:ADP-heptose:LPS heptosyltransferase